jgi:hypothetical protein
MNIWVPHKEEHFEYTSIKSFGFIAENFELKSFFIRLLLRISSNGSKDMHFYHIHRPVASA